MQDVIVLVAWNELEARLRLRRRSLTERAEAYVRSVRARNIAKTDRYAVVRLPPLPGA